MGTTYCKDCNGVGYTPALCKTCNGSGKVIDPTHYHWDDVTQFSFSELRERMVHFTQLAEDAYLDLDKGTDHAQAVLNIIAAEETLQQMKMHALKSGV